MNKQEAYRDAEALAKILGEGWNADVWPCGSGEYAYGASKGVARIHKFTTGYEAMFYIPKLCLGRGDTPQAAHAAAMRSGQEAVTKMQRDLDFLERKG